MPAFIRLEWKRLKVSNTLAFYDSAKVTAVQSFIVQAPYLIRIAKTFFFVTDVGAK